MNTVVHMYTCTVRALGRYEHELQIGIDIWSATLVIKALAQIRNTQACSICITVDVLAMAHAPIV